MSERLATVAAPDRRALRAIELVFDVWAYPVKAVRTLRGQRRC